MLTFIVIQRHPVAVSLATQKWSETSLPSLFAHWLHCQKLFEEDKRHLHHVYEVSYETYLAEPNQVHRDMAIFLGVSATATALEPLSADHNRAYLKRWSGLLGESRFRSYYRHVARKYQRRFAEFDYSLFDGAEPAVGVTSWLIAYAGISLSRWHGQRMEFLSKRIRSHFPEELKEKLKMHFRESRCIGLHDCCCPGGLLRFGRNLRSSVYSGRSARGSPSRQYGTRLNSSEAT